ncbi:hypothetical protein PMAYCL1PPCAC_04518 [Pristionchus mayeri]|uniref:Uncharacterized protein n=1 Tax=Pristionchus mayeri TaxID=1317129 RepID=A0AAN5C2B5_9BILA|nr:hypothetical protein PMAYCL1PPCAC_04518 [Pristionchus mayeri]
MLCPFPDGTIPIVYVNTFFSIFQYKVLIREGLVDDFWKTAARYLHCDRVSYSNDQYGNLGTCNLGVSENIRVQIEVQRFRKSRRVKHSRLST